MSFLPGEQISASERTSSWTTNNSTAGALSGVIPGLQTATITGEGHPVEIVFDALVQHPSAQGFVACYLMCNGSYTTFPAGKLASVYQGCTGSARTLIMRRTPLLVEGQEYNFQVGLYVGNVAGTAILAASDKYPAELSVTRR